jgi:SAM-dependent methyltransferase
VRVEAPTATITEPVTLVRGWITDTEPIGAVVVEVDGAPVPTRLVRRGGVERVFPDRHVTGFLATVDFRHQSSPPVGSVVALNYSGTVHPIVDVDVAQVAAATEAWRATKEEKLRRVASLLACPACGSPLVSPAAPAIFRCGCGAEYERTDTCIDLLSDELRDAFRLAATENVSSHSYPPQVQSPTGLFTWAAQTRGLVLDVGAGDQRRVMPHVICSEIVAYPATDVLAVVQRLPFRDGAFDGVFSAAVLEHVTDPFQAASEMMRVLRPGGQLFCSVPFLQPEHGYPHHYYNMTSDGLVNAFTRVGAKLDQAGIAESGHPWHAGRRFLSEYLTHLPPDDRQRMESMTVKELLRLPAGADEPLRAHLSDEGRRKLACTTYATFTKP